MNILNKTIVVVILLFLFLFLGLSGVMSNSFVYTGSTDNFVAEYPPWIVNGSLSDNLTVNSDDELTVESTAENGTYAYTSDIEDNSRFVKIQSFEYTADIQDAEDSIELRIFTSNDGFQTVDQVNSYELNSGSDSMHVNFQRSSSYRFQVLMTNDGQGQEPALTKLKVRGDEVEIQRDYSFIFKFIIMWVILFSTIIVAIS